LPPGVRPEVSLEVRPPGRRLGIRVVAATVVSVVAAAQDEQDPRGKGEDSANECGLTFERRGRQGQAGCDHERERHTDEEPAEPSAWCLRRQP
jgi:hypothetical protein